MGVFFLYTGLEVGAGQWEATFCRGHLALSPSEAGLATFGYWAALTAVRIGLALVPRPVSPRAVIRSGAPVSLLKDPTRADARGAPCLAIESIQQSQREAQT